MASCDLFAALTGVTGLSILGLLTVEGLGQQTCSTGLASAARTTKEIGMGQTVLGHGIEQGTRNSVLAHQIAKTLGAPLTVEGQVFHIS